MKNELDIVLKHIGDEFQSDIVADGRNYREVDIGKRAAALGFSDIKEVFQSVNAVVPIKEPVEGMKVMVDGRTFVNYQQFDSGIAVPGYVAQVSGLAHHPYVPDESMILNF